MKGGCGRLRGCFSSASQTVCPFSCTTHGVSQPQQPRHLPPGLLQLRKRREGAHKQLQRSVALSIPDQPGRPRTLLPDGLSELGEALGDGQMVEDRRYARCKVLLPTAEWSSTALGSRPYQRQPVSLPSTYWRSLPQLPLSASPRSTGRPRPRPSVHTRPATPPPATTS